MDVGETPGERPDVYAVRLTVEYQFANKAAHFQTTLHFKAEAGTADLADATAREARGAVIECARFVDAALGISGRPS